MGVSGQMVFVYCAVSRKRQYESSPTDIGYENENENENSVIETHSLFRVLMDLRLVIHTHILSLRQVMGRWK